AESAAKTIGTFRPCEVFTVLRTPTMRTSKRKEVRPVISANSLAVVNASSTVARPVSKTSSRASTYTFMAGMISKSSILTIVPRKPSAYTSSCLKNLIRSNEMVKFAFFARLEAKPGKENDVAKFLETGLELANKETTTPIWFALRLGPSVFGVFDAFNDEAGRQAHLKGPIAQALMA